MMGAWAYIVVLPAAYVVGSISFGILAGKIWRGVDVRRYGSGSSGTTNVLRTLGVAPAVLVLALDGAKGALVVVIAQQLGDSALLTSLAALLVVAGHNWPLFTGFRGGRGVITGLGAAVVMSPSAAVAALCALPVIAFTRFVSLGSIVGTAAVAVALIVLIILGRLPIEYLIFAIGGFVLIEARHWQNIGRLIRGTENRLGIPGRPKRAATPKHH